MSSDEAKKGKAGRTASSRTPRKKKKPMEKKSTENFGEIYQSADASFKDSFLIYKDKVPEFIVLPNLVIGKPLETEKTDVKITRSRRDLAFELADGRGLHLECEDEISEDDLRRFLIYNVNLTNTYNFEFITVVVTTKSPKARCLSSEQIKFNPRIVYSAEKDADTILDKIEHHLSEGLPINELELIYLPLCHSVSLKPVQILSRAIKVAAQMDLVKTDRDKLVSLLVVASDKVVGKDNWQSILEELKAMDMAFPDCIIEYEKERIRNETWREAQEKTQERDLSEFLGIASLLANKSPDEIAKIVRDKFATVSK